MKRFLSIVLMASFLFVGACGADAPGDAQASGDKQVIKFGDQQWQSLWINNAIAMFIVKHGYGYPVESVILSSPIMQQSLPQGEVDVTMELWRFNAHEWYKEVTAAGTMLDLGPTFEKSTQGWYVPRYVIEGDAERGIKALAPDLKSVADLARYWKLFQDPEDSRKGLLLNCITGWVCSKTNKIKLEAYGLDKYFNSLEPGTTPALDATIAGAYKKGKPVLTYYWEPTWLIGSLDMVQLEEPPHTTACWDRIQAALDKKPAKITADYGCAFQTFSVHKGVTAGLKTRAPEVVAFLEKMNVGTDPLNKTAAYMESNKTEVDQAAFWYFTKFPERWESWLPDDVKAKVKKALSEIEIQL